MSITAIRQEKKLLEVRLLDFVGTEIENFEKRTGIKVESVQITFKYYSTIGGERKKMFQNIEIDCEAV